MVYPVINKEHSKIEILIDIDLETKPSPKPPLLTLWDQLLETHSCPEIQSIAFYANFYAFILKDEHILFHRKKVGSLYLLHTHKMP